MKKLQLSKIQGLIDIAVEEDFGSGDPTTLVTVTDDAITETRIVSRQDVVVCGMVLISDILTRYDKRLNIDILIDDGQSHACRIEQSRKHFVLHRKQVADIG